MASVTPSETDRIYTRYCSTVGTQYRLRRDGELPSRLDLYWLSKFTIISDGWLGFCNLSPSGD